MKTLAFATHQGFGWSPLAVQIVILLAQRRTLIFFGVILSYLSDFSGESKEVSQKQVKKKKKGKNNNKNSSLMIIRKEHGRWGKTCEHFGNFVDGLFICPSSTRISSVAVAEGRWCTRCISDTVPDFSVGSALKSSFMLKRDMCELELVLVWILFRFENLDFFHE